MKNPQITQKEKTAYADGKELKTLSHHDLFKNFVLFKMPDDPKGFLVFPEKSYYLYLMDSEEEAKKMEKGKRGFPMFPMNFTPAMSFQTNSFKVFWKHPESKNVVGCLWFRLRSVKERGVDEPHILIEMMAVRDEYRHNRVNQIMIEKIVEQFELEKIDFGLTTPQGERFAKAYDKATGNRVKYFAP